MGEELHPETMGSRRKSFHSESCVGWCDLNVYNVLILIGLHVVSGLNVVVELKWGRMH